MIRYFFDLRNQSAIVHDFTGQMFSSPEQAQEYAELIAIDMACSEEAEDRADEVQVRDTTGKELFRIPVRSDLIAA